MLAARQAEAKDDELIPDWRAGVAVYRKLIEAYRRDPRRFRRKRQIEEV